jgi:acetolactate synthase-1/2/3 large subunit
VTGPGEIPQALSDLAQRAQLVPRPVYLEVPADVLAAGAPAREARGPLPPALGVEDADAVDRAAELLAAASRPLIWAGGGARDAGAQVRELAERLQAPVFTTYTARGLLGDHPLAIGLPPHAPDAGALWDAADAVVSVGSDLDGMNTQNWRMPRPPRLIVVNADAVDGTKNYDADEVVEGDAAIACAMLAQRLRADRRAWADIDEVRRCARSRLRADHPAELAFLDAFAAAVPDDAVVLADMCVPGYWIAGFHRFSAPRRLQYPMGWGTLGFAFPASIGAAVAADGRSVISVSGDGGFLFACGELATLAQERTSLTTVIVDDGGYGMLRYDQRRRGASVDYGIDLRTPDFVALARAFGLRAESVDGLGDAFARALERHVADAEPTVLVARAALQPPPTTSPRWHRTGPPHFAA